MALGTVVGGGNAKRAVCILFEAIANNSPPASSAAGIPVYPTNKISADTGLCFTACPAQTATLMIKGRCTAAETLAGTFTLWGYLAAADAWFEIPVNGGTAVTPVALAETSADQINYQERFHDLGHYDQLYLELAGISGAGAIFDAWLVTSRTVSF